MNPDADLKTSIRRDTNRRLIIAGNDGQSPRCQNARAVSGLLTVACEPDPNSPFVGLSATLAGTPGIQVDLIARQQQASLIIAAVIVFPCDIIVGHGDASHQVVMANFPGFAPNLARDRI